MSEARGEHGVDPSGAALADAHMQQGSLHHFSQLLDLLLTSTDVTVGHVGLLLHLIHNNGINIKVSIFITNAFAI